MAFAYLFLGGLGIILYFRDRGWHAAGALVAALAFAFGGSASARLQHIGQVISLAYLPIALWLLVARARSLVMALRRARRRRGRADRHSGAIRSRCSKSMCWRASCSRTGAARALRRACARASKPLIAGGIAGALIIALPVMLTELLALNSNRPEFSFVEAGRGSLHYTHLLSLVFPDLFGAMDPKVDFWGAGGFAWNERFGMADLFLAQNMGLLYAGALAPLLLILGVTRGWLWSREIRFFTIAARADRVLRLRLVHAGVPRRCTN